MSVYVAKSTDSSAPTLSGTAGDLTNLLDKLLVDGFGSYTSPGWSIEFTGTNKRAYRAASGNRFRFRVSDEGTGSASYARVVGYETMGNIDDNTGNAFPTEAQFSGGLYLNKSSAASATTRPWLFFSDGKLFYLSVQHDGTNWAVFYFGDIISLTAGDAYGTVIGMSEASSAGSSYANQRALAAGAFPSATTISGRSIARIYTQASGASYFGLVHTYAQASFSTFNDPVGASTGFNATYPNPASGGLLLSRYSVWEPTIANGRRGFLPGLWAPGHNKPLTHGDTFTGATGSDIAGRSFYVVSPIVSSSGTGQYFFETSDTWDS